MTVATNAPVSIFMFVEPSAHWITEVLSNHVDTEVRTCPPSVLHRPSDTKGPSWSRFQPAWLRLKSNPTECATGWNGSTVSDGQQLGIFAVCIEAQ